MARSRPGPLSEALSGKVGNSVFLNTAQGTLIRSYVIPTNPNTSAQTSSRSHFARAIIAYRNLTPEQADAWDEWAAQQIVVDNLTDKARVPTAYHVFIGLTTKFLQVTPTGTIPMNPPVIGFVGDALTITTTALLGKIRFTASGPNSANVVTELLLQPVRFKHQKVQNDKFRPAAFVAFASGSLSHDVTLSHGWYAVAYRCVNPTTGQQTPLVRLPAVQVP